MHFLPYVVLDGERVPEVVFACRSHDPGGYWLWCAEWNSGPPDWRDPTQIHTPRDHVLDKERGWVAIARLDERISGRRIRPDVVVRWRTLDGDVIETWGLL